jgi:precorrin-2/cobalt-factor-2 C20-methyltransferase
MSGGFQVQPGHFYAVGAGPGGADLLTLRAVRVIEHSQVIICPKSAASRSSLALEIIQDLISNQEVIEHVYPMRRSEEEVRGSWMQAARLILRNCRLGKTVTQVTLGDPHIYSTCAYVLPMVEQELGRDRVHVIPGITALQASASRFIQPLATQEDRVTLMPGSDPALVAKALDHCETLVLYKVGKNLKELAVILRKHGLEDRVRVVFNVEMGDREKVYTDIHQAEQHEPGYLACVIVYAGRRRWGEKERAEG